MEEMAENDMEETARAMKGIGDCLFGMGDYGEALRCFVEADKIIKQTNKTQKVIVGALVTWAIYTQGQLLL